MMLVAHFHREGERPYLQQIQKTRQENIHRRDCARRQRSRVGATSGPRAVDISVECHTRDRAEREDGKSLRCGPCAERGVGI